MICEYYLIKAVKKITILLNTIFFPQQISLNKEEN